MYIAGGFIYLFYWKKNRYISVALKINQLPLNVHLTNHIADKTIGLNQQIVRYE